MILGAGRAGTGELAQGAAGVAQPGKGERPQVPHPGRVVGVGEAAGDRDRQAGEAGRGRGRLGGGAGGEREEEAAESPAVEGRVALDRGEALGVGEGLDGGGTGCQASPGRSSARRGAGQGT